MLPLSHWHVKGARNPSTVLQAIINRSTERSNEGSQSLLLAFQYYSSIALTSAHCAYGSCGLGELCAHIIKRGPSSVCHPDQGDQIQRQSLMIWQTWLAFKMVQLLASFLCKQKTLTRFWRLRTFVNHQTNQHVSPVINLRGHFRTKTSLKM